MSDDNEDKPRPANAFPEAKLIAKTFGTDFNAVICKRKAIADIRELILDELTPDKPVTYNFHKNTLYPDVKEIMANLKENGYVCDLTSVDPQTRETRIVIALPKSK